MALNDKQKRFVDEYLIDLNATQAAIRAGYSEASSRTTSSRLLADANIQAFIQERMQQKDEELIMQQDEVLQRLTKMGRRQETHYHVVLSERPLYDDSGLFLGMEKKPEIVELRTENKDAIKALELLGKRHLLFTDKVEHSGNVELELSVDYGGDDDGDSSEEES